MRVRVILGLTLLCSALGYAWPSGAFWTDAGGGAPAERSVPLRLRERGGAQDFYMQLFVHGAPGLRDP